MDHKIDLTLLREIYESGCAFENTQHINPPNQHKPEKQSRLYDVILKTIKECLERLQGEEGRQI